MDEARASVEAALEMLQEETAALVEAARAQGAEAYARGDTKAFERLDGQTKRAEAFAEQVGALARQWRGYGRENEGRRERLFEAPNEDQRTRISEGRASSDSILEEREYVFPILEILRDAGGAARADHIIQRLEAMLGDRLTPLDRGAISNGGLRWHNRAHWVRRYMVLAGILRDDSPRGTWEITDAGRQALERGDLDEAWRHLMTAKKDG
jgi:hypothetical protein